MSEAAVIDTGLTSSTLQVSGMDCPDCAAKLAKAVGRIPGIVETNLVFANEKLTVTYAGTSDEVLPKVIDKIHALGYGASSPQPAKNMVIRLSGLDCADCAAKLEKAVARIPGTEKVQVNFGASKLQVSYPGDLTDVLDVIQRMGYSGTLAEDVKSGTAAKSFWKTNKSALSTVLSGSILLAAFILDKTGVLAPGITYGIYLAGIILGAYLPAKSGLLMLINAREIDMNVLMTIAIIGAVAIGEVEEGAMVVFLFSLGNTLQAYTLDKTRRSIASLMELTPNQALVRRDGHEFVLPVDNIQVGDIIIVKPGDRIPMDGRVVVGNSAVDQAAITGESIPVDKGPGDDVFAGTINQRGAMEIEVTKLSKDNTISRLITMVEDAQGQRAHSQQFVDKFAKYYTPSVIGVAALVAVIPPLAFNQPFDKWIYEALAMLLVACPCALVISTPVSIVSAIGNAAKQGVLFKGGVYLEEMAALSVVAFDKTGTLTQGKPAVTDVIPVSKLDISQVLGIASGIENRSGHPLGAAIVHYAKQQEASIPAVSDFENLTGKGARGMVEGRLYSIGSPKYIGDLLEMPVRIMDTVERLENDGKTVMLLADQEEVLGIIAVADVIRPASVQAITNLKKAGVKQVVMLTGDNSRTARAIAGHTGIDEFRAGLLPEDKVTVVKDLLATHGKVAMVGDGVNDAPAMAIATVGIAMGAAGTDTALETADVALMADDLSKLPYTIRLSKKTMGIMKQNIAFSLIIKAAVLSLVVPGMLTMWLAVIGDMGASLLVTLNGLRLLRVKDHS